MELKLKLKRRRRRPECGRWSFSHGAVSPRVVVCLIVYEPLVRYSSSATSAHARFERWDFNDHTKREVGVRVGELMRVY